MEVAQTAVVWVQSVIVAAISLIILGYLAVGFSGYLAFPTTVSSNALNNFSDSDVLMQVNQLICCTQASKRGRGGGAACKCHH